MSTFGVPLSASTRSARAVDLYAAGLSVLCLVHCLGLPLLTSVLPVFGLISENPLIHRGLVLLAAPATLWVTWKLLPTAGAAWSFIVVACGALGLMLLAAFVPAVSAYEQVLTVVGALSLASAHLWHWARHVQTPITNAKLPNPGDGSTG